MGTSAPFNEPPGSPLSTGRSGVNSGGVKHKSGQKPDSTGVPDIPHTSGLLFLLRLAHDATALQDHRSGGKGRAKSVVTMSRLTGSLDECVCVEHTLMTQPFHHYHRDSLSASALHKQERFSKTLQTLALGSLQCPGHKELKGRHACFKQRQLLCDSFFAVAWATYLKPHQSPRRQKKSYGSAVRRLWHLGSKEDCWRRRAVPEVTSCSTAGPLFGPGPGYTAIISHESFHMAREAAVSHHCFSCLPTKKKGVQLSPADLTTDTLCAQKPRKQGFSLSHPPLENTYTSVGYP
ncbi:Deoxyguanosinetriphosphate triphosphohydrolase-like protein [Dissostichus eleginoides]|uniref:Deoxyguanosinetriphosphate triphosphohydrolase-like protein n=1 Tax=Dissostichus eleginoides TaxID=100907 RepID=A0AAD9BRA4_DISEL|nr:Deoxyguanosinetriphosphate triphosphohydrolase-like protein [Dissostichus eleginoides]